MNTMNELIAKLQKVERRLTAERGAFALFALFRTESAPSRWDLVISAPWADGTEWKARRYVLAELQKELTLAERMKVDRIMVIPSDFKDLEELYEEQRVEHGKVIIHDREFGLQMVEEGYVITCRPPVAKAA
jgi:hypothetical protein